MPGVELPSRLETDNGNGGLPEFVVKFFHRCDDHFKKQAQLNKWLATREKPNTIWEGNSEPLTAGNAIEMLVYRVPLGMRLLVNRLIITADGLNPGAAKYTNAAAYWQLFDGPNQNQMSMPDFGALDGLNVGSSQLPLVNQYGTKGLIFEKGEVRMFLNLPAIAAGKNVVVMFTGWLEPPFPDTE